MRGNVALSLYDLPVVAAVPIEASQFSNKTELKALADAQGLPLFVVTQEAWHKYESFFEVTHGE